MHSSSAAAPPKFCSSSTLSSGPVLIITNQILPGAKSTFTSNKCNVHVRILQPILLLPKEPWSMVHACTICCSDQSSSPEALPCGAAGTTCVWLGLHTLRPEGPNSPHGETETNTWGKYTNKHLTGLYLGQQAGQHNRTRCSKAATVLRWKLMATVHCPSS